MPSKNRRIRSALALLGASQGPARNESSSRSAQAIATRGADAREGNRGPPRAPLAERELGDVAVGHLRIDAVQHAQAGDVGTVSMSNARIGVIRLRGGRRDQSGKTPVER